MLSRFDIDNLRRTLFYLVIGILLIAGSFFVGTGKGDSLNIFLFFIGCIMFFYGSLHPWEKAIYYIILSSVSVIFIILLFKVGIGIFVKIETKYQIPNRWAETMGWSIGSACLAAFIAGFVGMFRFRKYD